MKQAYIIARLKEMTMPELLDGIAEAHAGEAIDIVYKRVLPLNILIYLCGHEDHYKRNDGKRCRSC